MKKNKKTVILIIILIFGFLIRLIALNQSLWLDEGVTARTVQHFGLAQIIKDFSPNDFHPPLYYLLMKIWTAVFGYSEVALRMPSIIFSILSGFFIYLLGGIWAAAFFIFNPLIVYYSQEARMYMMATFFLTGAYYFFKKISSAEKLRKKTNIGDEIFFYLFVLLSLFTFYGSIFPIAAYFIYELYKKNFRRVFVFSLVLSGFFLIISPLLLTQLANAGQSLNQVANWSLVLGKANLKNLLLIPLKFSGGRISFQPKWVYYAVVGSWTVFVFWTAFRGMMKNRQISFFFLIPLVLGLVVSFVTPVLQYFRFIYLIPFLSILLSIRNIKRKNYLILSGFIIFSFVYLLIPNFHREDWKSLASSLKDGQVYMIKTSSDPLLYYRTDLVVNDLANLQPDLHKNRLVVIPYSADIHGVNYRETLNRNGYRLFKKEGFRELEVEHWERY